MFYTVSAVLKP